MELWCSIGNKSLLTIESPLCLTLTTHMCTQPPTLPTGQVQTGYTRQPGCSPTTITLHDLLPLQGIHIKHDNIHKIYTSPTGNQHTASTIQVIYTKYSVILPQRKYSKYYTHNIHQYSVILPQRKYIKCYTNSPGRLSAHNLVVDL